MGGGICGISNAAIHYKVNVLEASGGRLESVLGRLGGVLRRVEVVLGRLGVVLRCLGGVFDVSFRVLGAS